MSLIFVTGNAGKIQEANHILGITLKSEKLDLPEIQELSIEKVVIAKTTSAFAVIDKPLIVDDSGFYFDAWNGFPGPMVKWIDTAGGTPLILKMLQHEPNRSAQAVCCIGYHDGTSIHTFTGTLEGNISDQLRGGDGWGWDPIFIPKGMTKTFAEMSLEEKSAISHRKLALEKLKTHLSLNTPHSHNV